MFDSHYFKCFLTLEMGDIASASKLNLYRVNLSILESQCNMYFLVIHGVLLASALLHIHVFPRGLGGGSRTRNPPIILDFLIQRLGNETETDECDIPDAYKRFASM